MKLVKWIKEKYQNRRNGRSDHDPWWVTMMLDVGRPAVAVLILTMSAPGEHYLAVQAGWSDGLAWGMPGALTAYAGIAAVVATKRPAGAPGRKTAIWGAILSILLAMAAQPVAHLWGKFGEPTQTQVIVLTVVVSCIPAAVFGHLLHMGAVSPVIAGQGKKAPSSTKSGHDRGQGKKAPSSTRTVRTDTDKIAEAFDVPASVLLSEADRTASDGHGQPDTDSRTLTIPDGHGGTRTLVPDTDTSGQWDTAAPNVRRIKTGSVSADVRTFLDGHPDIVDAYLSGNTAADTDLAGHIALKRPAAKWDSVRKARDRYLDRIKVERGA